MIASGACAAQDSSVISASRLSLERARRRFSELEDFMLSEEAKRMPLHELEVEQERRNREVQRLLLQAQIQSRGTGDVGRAVEVIQKSDDGTETVNRHGQRRLHQCQFRSIFGEVTVRRTGYVRSGSQSIHPLDQTAALPERSFSQEIQRRLVIGAIQGPFDEAIERVQEATAVRVSKRSAEDIVRDCALDFDEFYRGRKAPPASQTGPILVAAIDCKGIPMVKPEKVLRVVRRGRGKKANKKRMATVAAVFTQQPRPRTPEQVVESLFREGPRVVSNEDSSPRLRPEHKRVWASVEKSKDEVIAEIAREVFSRDPGKTKQRVLVIDGERALQRRAARAIPDATEVLDLLHVTEKIWMLSYYFHDEGSDEAREWVRERTLRILRGGVSQVIKGIRQSATKQGFKGESREAVDKATGYLYRNRHRMRYDQYLRKGFPIASGSVEGACKNLIKDRMERSGMRWTIPTAEALVKLRAAYLSDDFEDHWRYHVHQEQQRLYPPGRWRGVEE